ncbi:hypothetical protein [Saccharothrix lopnurensis]|uniref:TniQ protein n=1 Tax=Saccharothrix lopnurensis TaxID=1670621 RepID=A0ABW1P6T8_9PSEU
MNPLADQLAAAKAEAAALVERIGTRAGLTVTAPPTTAARLLAALDDAGRCLHVKAMPYQPTFVLGLSEVVECERCFLDRLAQDAHSQRRVCQFCGQTMPGALSQYLVRAGHLVLVLLLCSSCEPPEDLRPGTSAGPTERRNQ